MGVEPIERAARFTARSCGRTIPSLAFSDRPQVEKAAAAAWGSSVPRSCAAATPEQAAASRIRLRPNEGGRTEIEPLEVAP